MAQAKTAGLSEEEFQRLQTSLLELRSANYQLTEQTARKDREIALLGQRLNKLDEELQKNIKNKRARSGEVIDSAESDVLRQKLAIQEEEFRLQQATLIGELQRVIAQQEELEQQVQELKNTKNESEDGDTCPRSALEELRADYEKRLENVQKEVQSKKSTSLPDEQKAEDIARLERDLADLKNALSSMEKQKDDLTEGFNKDKDQLQSKTIAQQKELTELKEQLRRKQASYVALTEEKERQLTEFKKSLDSVTKKKDSQIERIEEELKGYKRRIQMAEDTERVAFAEKASFETALKEAHDDVQKLREQNEMFQIQLQETISANDCLSGQLQETRQEVERMQAQLHQANELASNRKSLLDEMNVHLETVKEEYQNKEKELLLSHETEVADLKEQLNRIQQRLDDVGPMEERTLLLESLLQTSEDRASTLEIQVQELNSNLQSCELKQREELTAQQAALQCQVDEVHAEMEALRKATDQQVSSLTMEHDEQVRLVQQLKQEIKDKEDAVQIVERKYQSVMKDLKRQLQGEKKRYDRLQEKMQEHSPTAPESTRNRSPGNSSFEEIKQSELTEGRLKTVGDAASVSSWTVVCGSAQKDNDRHSLHTGDRNSESSITMLESDNHELITRLTESQRKNYELQERVSILEETNMAMAEDLINKAGVIEQFVKQKSAGFHIGGPTSPEKLPPGLKKFIDLVKIDQSAAEIRDMNKRLQRMLEETLTKNMHLQKDLEVMSEEVARLTSSVGHDEKRC